jgi:6-pyruvoyltetrahydropterin/6-carboxytetrahydropterin synthase
MKITAVREHSFDAGHRVVGHAGHCRNCHGHRYTVQIFCEPVDGLDALGMVVDFGVIKTMVCVWIDDNLDHRFIAWKKDPLGSVIEEEAPGSVYWLDDNPTAENIAAMLLLKAGELLAGHGVNVVKIVVHETAKCRAEVEL